MGLLGQIGDIIQYSAVVRRVRQLYPNSEITFAVSERYREAGELVAGLPYVNRLFVTWNYFDKLTPALSLPWETGWPVDLRGDDEIEEQRRHDMVLETRPRHRRMPWWQHAHTVAELAHMVGVPGPIDLQTEIAIPPGTAPPLDPTERYVLHNDPVTDARKAWPWESLQALARALGPERCVLLGGPGPEIEGATDMRGRTTLAEAAAVIAGCRCYIGIDSGLMWIAGSLQVPVVGLYGTDYIAAYEAIYPVNPRAVYLQAEGSVGQISVERVLRAVSGICGREQARETSIGRLPEVNLSEIAPSGLLPSLVVEASSINGALSMRDLLPVLALLYDRQPSVVLEIGTFFGHTTRHFARCLPHSTIHTVDLPLDFEVEGQDEPGLRKDDPHLIRSRRVGAAFQGEPECRNIVQHWGDTASWDFTAVSGASFFFIDGSHTYEYVKNDTLKCLGVSAPVARFVWHDCNVGHPGVVRFLTEFAADHPGVVRIRGTDLAVWDRKG
jgi:ADP-heptose:LPS heptosyltransferase